MAPVDVALLGRLRHASDLWARGKKSLAQIYLTQLRLPPIDEEQALRLHLADRMMASGFSPRELCKELGFELPAGLRKFDPAQPRDEQGRWTVAGGSAAAPQAVTEGRSISPGGPRGGEESEEDKLEDFKSKFEEDSPQEDLEHGRPIDPVGPTPVPVPSSRSAPAAAGPKPSDFVDQDFGKYGVGVDVPDLKIRYLTHHSLEQEARQPLSREEIDDVVSNPLLVTRQSSSRFYFLNDNGAVVVDDSGRVVTNYGSSDFKQGVLDMLARIHSGGR